MRETLGAHAALLSTALIFSANFSIAKEVMPAWVGSSGFIVLRVVPTALVFFLLHALTVRERVGSVRDFLLLTMGAALGIAGNQLLIFGGLSRTSPINTALLFTLAPVVVLLTAALTLGERITTRRLVGAALSGGGAILLILQGAITDAAGSFAGDLLVVGSALSYGVYLVMIRPLTRRYHPFTIMKWNFVMAVPLVMPFGAADLGRVNWPAVPPYVWGCAAFVVLGATLLTYLL
ncbi:MAG: DMT family transporter, partial [Catalinimonas sp.]